MTSISLAEGSKPEPVQDMKKQAEISASASEQALASTLQAQIAAAGCSNLQHYALWLQARYQLLASSAAAEQATAMSANFGLSPPYDYNAPAISVSPFQTSQYQTSFYNSSASSPPHSASPWSQPSMSPTSFAQEASGLQDIHTDYQPVSKESLFPMSSAPSFPHWSNSTSSSDSGSLLYPEYRFSGSDESARGVQARLAYAYQSAADATQQGQAESVTACLGQQYTGAHSLLALQHCHKNSILMGDVKPMNILLRKPANYLDMSLHCCTCVPPCFDRARLVPHHLAKLAPASVVIVLSQGQQLLGDAEQAELLTKAAVHVIAGSCVDSG